MHNDFVAIFQVVRGRLIMRYNWCEFFVWPDIFPNFSHWVNHVGVEMDFGPKYWDQIEDTALSLYHSPCSKFIPFHFPFHPISLALHSLYICFVIFPFPILPLPSPVPCLPITYCSVHTRADTQISCVIRLLFFWILEFLSSFMMVWSLYAF